MFYRKLNEISFESQDIRQFSSKGGKKWKKIDDACIHYPTNKKTLNVHRYLNSV